MVGFRELLYFYIPMIVQRLLSLKNLIPATFVLAALLLYGYQFNNGDQEELLPFVYRILNPACYPGDSLVDFQTSCFNIRTYFAYLLAAGNGIAGMAAWCFILHVACLFVMCRSLTNMAIRRSAWNISSMLPAVLLLVFFSVPVGGNTLFDIQLTPTMPALALGCVALENFDARRYSRAFLLTGIATCFQFLIGLQLMLLMLFSVLLDRHTLSIKARLKLVLFYLIAAAPMLVPLMYRQFMIPFSGDHEGFFQVLFIFRNGHHYDPASFPLTSYLKAAGFILLMLLVFIRQTREKNGKAPQFMLAVLLGCIVYSIGFAGLSSATVAKTQWFKSTIWMTLYGIPVLSAYLADRIRTDHILPAPYLLISCAVATAVLFNSARLPFKKMENRYRLGNYKKSDLQKIHEWMAVHLPDSAIVLSFPSDDALRCEVRRSTPVTFKAIVHEPAFMLEWYRRIHDYYHLSAATAGSLQQKIQQGDSRYHTVTVPDLLQGKDSIDFLIINTMQIGNLEIPRKKMQIRIGDYAVIGLR